MKPLQSNGTGKYFSWELEDFQQAYNNEAKFKTIEGGVERLMYPPEVRKVDPHFYGTLQDEGWLKEVITNRKNFLTKGWDEEDFKNHIEENFEGLTYSEIKEANWNFIQTVYRKKFRHLLPQGDDVVKKSIEDIV